MNTWLLDQTKSNARFKGFNGTTSSAEGCGGMVGVSVTTEGKKVFLKFPKTHIVEGIQNDLISVDTMVNSKFSFWFSQTGSYIETPNKEKLPLERFGGLFWLKWHKATKDKKERKSSKKRSREIRNIQQDEEDLISNLRAEEVVIPDEHTLEEVDLNNQEINQIEPDELRVRGKHLFPAGYFEDGSECLNAQDIGDHDPFNINSIKEHRCEVCAIFKDRKSVRFEKKPPDLDKKRKVNMQIHHRRMAHFNKTYLQIQANQGDLGNVILEGSTKSICDTCKIVKTTRNNPPKEREHHPIATKPFQQVWSDVKGPLKADFFNKVCETLKVKQRFTAYYTPAQNGVSERINRVYCDCAASIIHDAALGHQYWSLFKCCMDVQHQI
mmetsp:Transcript_9599/g.11625  ORF Transcript_9599/g.11625 Transcript_9599/m.11625 type:complete len:382 (-) Transcript_9599:320-1465(-)